MNTVLSVAAYLDTLRREGDLLATATERAGMDAEIGTCPGWRMRDLVQHTGGVHRWAAIHLRDRRTTGLELADPADIVDELPDDAGLVAWFREGHAALVDTLANADPDVVCWSFLPAPTPLLFWARRQTHETTIHRVDAEQPGGAVTPVAAPVAADGIDELLAGFAVRPRVQLRSASPRTLAVHATDTGDHWTLHIGPDPLRTTRELATAPDATVRGSASDLYLTLWNRAAADDLDIAGDLTLVARWCDAVQVRWSRGARSPRQAR